MCIDTSLARGGDSFLYRVTDAIFRLSFPNNRRLLRSRRAILVDFAISARDLSTVCQFSHVHSRLITSLVDFLTTIFSLLAFA